MLALIAMEEVGGVAAISIRNLDEWVVERIRVRASEHGNSMEAEVRSILVDAAREPGIEYGLGDQIHALFEGIGDDLELPERRKDHPRAAEFDL
jgi:plasmid stability protein